MVHVLTNNTLFGSEVVLHSPKLYLLPNLGIRFGRDGVVCIFKIVTGTLLIFLPHCRLL